LTPTGNNFKIFFRKKHLSRKFCACFFPVHSLQFPSVIKNHLFGRCRMNFQKVSALVLGLAFVSFASAEILPDPAVPLPPTAIAGQEHERPSAYERATSPSYTRSEREAARAEYTRERGYNPGWIDPGYSMKCDPSVSQCG
jgi:hypothetical protein